MKKLATLLALIAALAIAVPVAAQARHAADDPVGHIRHSGDDRAGDDSSARRSTVTTAKGTKSTKVDRHRHGADDAPGDDRGRHGGHGSDDGPNHT